MKFRKRPIEVEAIQMPTKDGDFTRAPAWLKEAMEAGFVWYDDKLHFAVNTLEGVMRGAAGDWIIQGVEREIYPCKRTIFETTYERAPTGIPLLGS